MSSNRTRNGSRESTDTVQNAVTGIMTENGETMTETARTGIERTTTEIVMIATMPQTMTEEETTDGTRNDRGIGIIDATTEEDIFLGKSVGKQPEITIRD